MVIAVTHENGNVFQHFGKSEQFKIYECDGGEVKSSEVIGNGGAGHEALVDVLVGKNVTVLICGGIGPGAVNALSYAGINVCAGAEGDCDAAVKAFLKGDLDCDDTPNCDHHEGGHSCGGHSSGGCGGR